MWGTFHSHSAYTQKPFKDVFLFCGNTCNFHFLRSNGILWVLFRKKWKFEVFPQNKKTSLFITCIRTDPYQVQNGWCVGEHSIAGAPASLYYLTKSVPDPLLNILFSSPTWHSALNITVYMFTIDRGFLP